MTGGRGADIVIEAAGPAGAVRDALEMVRDGGRVVVCGQYTDSGTVPINPHLHINRKHVELRGCWGSDYSHFHRSVQIAAQHQDQVPWGDMVDHRFTLDQAQQALEAVAARSLVKAIVTPNVA
jgi:L-iditol 2-dehydrogenase